jgi:hypothetical protein
MSAFCTEVVARGALLTMAATACALTPVEALTTPSLTAEPSSPLLIGGVMTDTAVLVGGTDPSGTITFTLFDGSKGCATLPLLTSVKSVSGNGSYTSDAYGPLAAGPYLWQVNYSGDSSNSSMSVECGYGTQVVAVPQYCPSTPPCGVVASGCPGGLTIGNNTFTNSTTSCVGSSPATTITTRSYIGPNDLCTGAEESIPCHVGAGDVTFATNTETVIADAVVVPTLSLWGLSALGVVLCGLALRGLTRRRIQNARTREVNGRL